MDYIRCGEDDCGQVASTENIVEMANLIGGMMGGLYRHPQEYRCPSGHVTTIKSEWERLKHAIEGPHHHGEDA